MGRRVLIASLVAAAGLVAFVVVLLRSETGGRHLCALAQSALRDATGLPVDIGRCSVDPLGPRVVVDRVRLGSAERPVLFAERLSVALSPGALLGGRVRVDRIEILEPRVDLDLSALGGSAEAPRAPGASCLPDPGPLELESFSLSGGSVTLALPGGRAVTSRGVNVSVAGKGRRLRVTAGLERTALLDASTDAQPAAPVVLERAGLRGEIDLGAGTAKVEALDVGAREGSLFARGELSSVCAPRGSLTATAQVDLGALGRTLLHAVPGLAGEASLGVRARLDGARYEVDADLRVRASKVLDFSPGDFEASVTATPERLVVRSVELPLESGRIQASGAIDLAEPYQATADATLKDFSLGELLEKLGVDALPVHVQASGTAHLAGPLLGKGGPRLAGRLSATVPAFGVYDGSFRDRARVTRYVGFSKGRLDGTFVLLQDRLALSEAIIRVGASEVHASGLVHFDSMRGLQLEVRAPALSLGDLGPFADAELLGRGTVTGTVEGPYRWLDIKGRAFLRDGSAVGVKLGTVGADAHLDLKAMELDVPSASGARGRSTWSGAGHLSLHDDMELDAYVDLDQALASDLVSMVDGLVPSLEVVERNAEALVTGRVHAGGPVTEPLVTGTLALEDVSAWGQRFESGTVEARVEGTTAVRIPKLELRRGEGTVTASGELTIDDLAYKFRASTRKLYLKDLDAVAAALPELRGGITASLRGEGTVDSPRARGRLTLRDMRLGEQPVATARLFFSLEGDEAAVRGTLASPWPRGSKPPPRARGEPYPLPPGSMFHRVNASIALAGDLPFSARLDVDVPDARVVAPALPEGLQASASGTATAEGLLLRPDTLRASVELDRLSARYGRVRVENSAPAVATLEGGRLQLVTLPLRGTPTFALDAAGLREPDGRLALTAAGNADLAVLSELVPALAESGGRADFEVTLAGTAEAPTLVGNARVEGLQLRPRDLPLQLADTSGGVTFSRDTVVLDGIEGSLNGAPVSLAGELRLEELRPASFQLQAQLDEVPVPLDDDLSLWLSGTPALSGTLEQMTLGGDVEIAKFRFRRNLELERMLVELVEVGRYRPPTPKVFERSGEFLLLDLGVHLGDVRIENNLLRADLRGDLRATGSNRRPGLLGTVTVVDGKALVRNTEYVVTSGVVSFTDKSRIRPVFDVRADARVREYDIHVNASGTPQQPRVLLSSEPSLPEADIVTLLTLGVIARDFDRTGTQSLTGLALDAAYNASGLNERIRTLLPQNEVIKDTTFRVSSAYDEMSGNIEPVAQLETSFLVEGLKLRGQTSLLGGRNRRAQVVYQFDDVFGAQLQWDSVVPSAPSFGDIGMDATLRKEWP